jgi:hypothetical protein
LRGNGSWRSGSIAPHNARVKAAAGALTIPAHATPVAAAPLTVHLVAIAWLYVTLLMAATEPSLVGGLLTFLAYGLVPLAIFLYVFGRRRRRSPPVREPADQPDRRDAEPDQ